MEDTTMGLALEDDVPSPLRNLYEFLNTLDERRFVKLGRRHPGGDDLRSERDIARWLRRRGLLGPREGVTAADRGLMLTLRDRLRSVLHARAAGMDPRSALDEVNELARRLSATPVFDDEGAPGLEPGGVAVKRALAQLLADAVEAQHVSLWPRLKMCASEECRWVFYDHSKPRTGRWCSTAVCGNREKRRAYRRRHARGVG
jgi:predicted RNA-binding Zn ribbon-like protein